MDILDKHACTHTHAHTCILLHTIDAPWDGIRDVVRASLQQLIDVEAHRGAHSRARPHLDLKVTRPTSRRTRVAIPTELRRQPRGCAGAIPVALLGVEVDPGRHPKVGWISGPGRVCTKREAVGPPSPMWGSSSISPRSERCGLGIGRRPVRPSPMFARPLVEKVASQSYRPM